jgi:hypothetical protein
MENDCDMVEPSKLKWVSNPIVRRISNIWFEIKDFTISHFSYGPRSLVILTNTKEPDEKKKAQYFLRKPKIYFCILNEIAESKYSIDKGRNHIHDPFKIRNIDYVHVSSESNKLFAILMRLRLIIPTPAYLGSLTKRLHAKYFDCALTMHGVFAVTYMMCIGHGRRDA